MSKLLFSIITPLYNTPLTFLKVCMESLQAQHLQECEFIVVSDGATKEENEICENFARKDSRFKFFKRPHMGVSASRNFALRQAQGEYIGFVDADDYIDATMLQECYAFASSTNSDIVTKNIFRTRNGQNTLMKQKPSSLAPEAIIRDILLEKILGGICYRFVKRTFLLEHNISFQENLCYGEDAVFWINLLLKKPKVSYLNKAFYHYVDNAQSITKKYTKNSYQENKKYISTLKSILDEDFLEDINVAALNVKVSAMRAHLMTLKEFSAYEKTYLKSIWRATFRFSAKLYLTFYLILSSCLAKYNSSRS